MRHGVRSYVEQFIDMFGICLVCQQNCHTRLQTLAHCVEKRCRSKTARVMCRDVLLSGMVRPISAEILDEARQIDRGLREQAVRSGHTHATVRRHAKRHVPLASRQSCTLSCAHSWSSNVRLKRKTSFADYSERVKRGRIETTSVPRSRMRCESQLDSRKKLRVR